MQPTATEIEEPHDHEITPRYLFVRQLLSAATIALGFGTVWLVLALFLGGLAVEAWPGPDANWPPRQMLVVKRDGTPLIKSIPRSNPLDATYSDMSGRTVPAPAKTDLIEPVQLFGGKWWRTSWLSEIPWQSRLKPFVEPEHPSVIWYFIHDGKPDGAGYFAGYDRSTNRPVGFIGDSGFTSDRPAPGHQFPVRGSLLTTFWSPSRFGTSQGQVVGTDPLTSGIPLSAVYVPCSNRLRVLDLRTRTVSTVFEAPEPFESFGICRQDTAGKTDLGRQPAVVMRTAHTIVAMNSAHEILSTFTLPDKLQDSYMIAWYPLDNGEALTEFYHLWQTDLDENIAPRHDLLGRSRWIHPEPDRPCLAERHAGLEQTEGVIAPGRGAAGALGLARCRVVLRIAHQSGAEHFGGGADDDRIVMAVIAGCGDLGAVAFHRLVAEVARVRPAAAAPDRVGHLRLSVRNCRLCRLSLAPPLGGPRGVPQLS